MQQINRIGESSLPNYKLTWLKTLLFMTQILLCH